MHSKVMRNQTNTSDRSRSLFQWTTEVLITFFVRDWGWLLVVTLAFFTLRVSLLWQDQVSQFIGSRAAIAVSTAILLMIPVVLICCCLLMFCIQQVISNYWSNSTLGINPPTAGLIAEYDVTQFLQSALIYCTGGFVIASVLVAWLSDLPILRGIYSPPVSYLELWLSGSLMVKRFVGD